MLYVYIWGTTNWPLYLFILFIINKDKNNGFPNRFKPTMRTTMTIVMSKKMSGPISPFSSGISTKIVPFVKFWNRKAYFFIDMNYFPSISLGWNQVLEVNDQEAFLFSKKIFSLRLDNIGEELLHIVASLWLISDSGHIELRVQLIY